MPRRAERLVGRRGIRRSLQGQLGNTAGFVCIFDSQVEFSHCQQTFRVQLGQRFHLVGRFNGCRALSPQEQVCGNARNYFGEQAIGHVGWRLSDRQPELLQTAFVVAGLQLLIAQHCVRYDD